MKFVSWLTAGITALLLLLPSSIFAAEQESVEKLIAGKQDFLVFGSIGSVNGGGTCSVDIIEEIGETATPETENAEEGDEEAVSLVGKSIEVSGFTSYMYFDGDAFSPKVGDNVLLSLRFSGNVYNIENGAYLVTTASYEYFRLQAPENLSIDDSSTLTALYMFVRSNGKNADYSIKDGAVYTHENGKKKSVAVPQGISFVDEAGKITMDSPHEKNDTFDFVPQNNKWLYALAILLVGSVLGVFVTKIFTRVEKRSDKS